MRSSYFDPQGYFLGVPYDFRKPTLARVLHRLYNPGGPMFSPHVFGWGYSLNLAHKGSWLFLGGVALLAGLLCLVAR